MSKEFKIKKKFSDMLKFNLPKIYTHYIHFYYFPCFVRSEKKNYRNQQAIRFYVLLYRNVYEKKMLIILFSFTFWNIHSKNVNLNDKIHVSLIIENYVS